MASNRENIRNFCIVAHIDHGKSTLADRILERTDTISDRDMKQQVLDAMDLERERGITIKASAVRMTYDAKDGETYTFNLIDTPGHVDFQYEVSRALRSCEGAVLLIDVSQGVEAQTVANAYLAMEEDLEIIPVVNKIDLDLFEPERAVEEVQEQFGIVEDEIIFTSGKTGEGVDELLEAIVHRIPAPASSDDEPLRALIFDSDFDTHRGVIAYVRLDAGTVEPGDRIQMMGAGKEFEVSEVGVFSPDMTQIERLTAGDVGYLMAGIKGVKEARVGDTITHCDNPTQQPFEGYREAKPMVFCGLYPSDNADYGPLQDALDKLSLNDAAFKYQRETSAALGFGFRCGFLGLLHMEVIQERLEREYGLDLVRTAPNVVYRIMTSDEDILEIENPAQVPDRGEIEIFEEPVVDASITVPQKYVGPCMELADERRGQFEEMDYLYGDRVVAKYTLPLAEIVVDFYDMLKSATRGYASMDYDFAGYEESDLSKVDILINGDPVDALAIITHRDRAHDRGKIICRKLKEKIPRQLFEVRIQAAIGGDIVASTKVRPIRKDVLEKCYGGDVTRKRKLLERQKEGKRRMKQVGSVDVPQEAFMAVLDLEDE